MIMSRFANGFYDNSYAQLSSRTSTPPSVNKENTYSSYGKEGRTQFNNLGAYPAYAEGRGGEELGERFIKGHSHSPKVVPTNIFQDFYQGRANNCVIISAIKLAMMKFGHNPHHIYKKIEVTSDGFNVTMRDGYKVHITPAEIIQAAKAADFRGSGSSDVQVNAQFLYAVSAKRLQQDRYHELNNETYVAALQMMGSGDYPGEALRRLGLKNHMVAATMRELRKGGTGSMSMPGHMVVVVDGYIDDYGKRVKLAGSGMAITGRIGMTLR